MSHINSEHRLLRQHLGFSGGPEMHPELQPHPEQDPLTSIMDDMNKLRSGKIEKTDEPLGDILKNFLNDLHDIRNSFLQESHGDLPDMQPNVVYLDQDHMEAEGLEWDPEDHVITFDGEDYTLPMQNGETFSFTMTDENGHITVYEVTDGREWAPHPAQTSAYINKEGLHAIGEDFFRMLQQFANEVSGIQGGKHLSLEDLRKKLKKEEQPKEDDKKSNLDPLPGETKEQQKERVTKELADAQR